MPLLQKSAANIGGLPRSFLSIIANSGLLLSIILREVCRFLQRETGTVLLKCAVVSTKKIIGEVGRNSVPFFLEQVYGIVSMSKARPSSFQEFYLSGTQSPKGDGLAVIR